MTELLSQLWTEELQTAFTVILAAIAVLYVLSIVWVIRDAYLRGTMWYIWAVVALIPLFGVIAYCLLRPPLYQIDRDEQELEIALKQRELMHFGECANCGYPVESDYAICPNCQQRLKNLCPVCNHALDPNWTVCAYCATPVSPSGSVAINGMSSYAARRLQTAMSGVSSPASTPVPAPQPTAARPAVAPSASPARPVPAPGVSATQIPGIPASPRPANPAPAQPAPASAPAPAPAKSAAASAKPAGKQNASQH